MLRLAIAALLLASACTFEIERTLAEGDLRGTAVFVDDQGATVPAAGARVALEGSAVTVKADAQGRFVLRRLPPASRYVLRIVHDADGDGTDDAGLRRIAEVAPGDKARDLGKVIIGAMGAIEGRLVRGNEPALGRVTLLFNREAKADANGFRLDRLLPGDYDIVPLDAEGRVFESSVVTVKPRETTHVDFDFGVLVQQEFGQVAGKVLRAGGGSTRGAQVSIPGALPSPITVDDEAGGFAEPQIPAGVYTLRASYDGYREVQLPFVVIAGETVVPDLLLVEDDRTCANEGEPVSDDDLDADGVPDSQEPEACLCSPGFLDTDEDGLCDHADRDLDGDAVDDALDNCLGTNNPDQADEDLDGIGDACEDSDDDGVPDLFDNCPDVANSLQENTDPDAFGDACDACVQGGLDDADGDELCGGADNCPDLATTDTTDADEDGIGDVCDACVQGGAEDPDGDEICGTEDNCRDLASTDLTDSDADGFGDVCDTCPEDANPDQDPGLCTGPPALTCTGASCLDFAFPAGNLELPRVRRVPGSDEVVVLADGVVLRGTGTSWTQLELPPAVLQGRWVQDVIAFSANDIVVVGSQGLFARWFGGSWSAIEVPLVGEGGRPDLERLDGTSFSDLFVAGSGVVFAFDGQGFTMESTPLVWNTSILELRVAGGAAWLLTREVLLQRESTGWVERDAIGQGGYERFNPALWVAPNGHAHAVRTLDDWTLGSTHTLKRYDGVQAYDVASLPSDVLSMDGLSATDLWLFTRGGFTHWNGAVPRRVPSALPSSESPVGSLAVVSATDAWASGPFGTLYRYDGARWNHAFGSNPIDVTDIAGRMATDVWVLESGGFLRRFDGTAWDLAPPVPAFAPDFLEAGEALLWAGSADGTFATFDGTAWTSVDPLALGECPGDRFFGKGTVEDAHVAADGTFSVLATIRALDQSQLCVGRTAVFTFGAAGGWVEVAEVASDAVTLAGPPGGLFTVTSAGNLAFVGDTQGTQSTLIDGVSAAWGDGVEVWAVGSGASHGIDGTFTGDDSLGQFWFTDLHGTPSGDVFFVGDGGAVVHATGPTAQLLPTPTSRSLRAVWASSPNDVWVGGEELLHWNGARWTTVVAAFDRPRLDTAVAGPAGGLFAAGPSGAYRYGTSGWERLSGAPDPGYEPVGIATLGVNEALFLGPRFQVRFDGAAWIPDGEGFGGFEQLVGVAALGADEAIAAVRFNDGIYRWTRDSLFWAEVASCGDAQTPLRALDSAGPSATWLVGEQGLVCRWNAVDGTLVAETSGTTATLSVVSAFGPDDAWAGSDGGLLRRTSAGWAPAELPAELPAGLSSVSALQALPGGGLLLTGSSYVEGPEQYQRVAFYFDGVGWLRLPIPSSLVPQSYFLHDGVPHGIVSSGSVVRLHPEAAVVVGG